MRKTIGILALMGLGVCVVVMMISFAMGVFLPDYPFVFCVLIFSYLGCAVLSVVCLAKDVLRFIGKHLGIGSHYDTQETVCFYCGAHMNVNSKFCPNCGKAVGNVEHWH